MTDGIERAKVLLKAAHEILRQSDTSYYVVSAMELTAFYDEAECDGHCLGTDIENWFLEIGEPMREHFT